MLIHLTWHWHNQTKWTMYFIFHIYLQLIPVCLVGNSPFNLFLLFCVVFIGHILQWLKIFVWCLFSLSKEGVCYIFSFLDFLIIIFFSVIIFFYGYRKVTFFQIWMNIKCSQIKGFSSVFLILNNSYQNSSGESACWSLVMIPIGLWFSARMAASDLFHIFTQSAQLYTFHYHISKYRCLKNVIRQIDSKMNGCSCQQGLRNDFGLVFVLTLENAFS